MGFRQGFCRRSRKHVRQDSAGTVTVSVRETCRRPQVSLSSVAARDKYVKLPPLREDRPLCGCRDRFGPSGMATRQDLAPETAGGGFFLPVAGYMMAKRGVKIEAVYFHAPPYTSERAKQKVVDLAKLVSEYAGEITLHVVNFTDIQMYIYDKCPHDELTIIMRRYMMKIAEYIGKETGCLSLITGESVGQVASQTMQSLVATNAVCTMPVFRPVIAFDKQDIIDIAEKINTFETSILPYEDCCTTFVAKHPVTKPDLERIEKSETHLSEKIDEMFETAVTTREIIKVSPDSEE